MNSVKVTKRFFRISKVREGSSAMITLEVGKPSTHAESLGSLEDKNVEFQWLEQNSMQSNDNDQEVPDRETCAPIL